MFDLIKVLDFKSPKPSVLVNITSRFKNIWGELLTIVSFLSIFVFSFILFVKLLKRENMTIVYYEEFIEQHFLNLTNFPVFFEVYNSIGIKIENASRLFSIKSKMYLIQDILVNGTIKKERNYSPLDITKCPLLRNKSYSYYNYDYLANSDFSDKLCLDLSGGFFSIRLSWIPNKSKFYCI